MGSRRISVPRYKDFGESNTNLAEIPKFYASLHKVFTDLTARVGEQAGKAICVLSSIRPLTDLQLQERLDKVLSVLSTELKDEDPSRPVDLSLEDLLRVAVSMMPYFHRAIKAGNVRLRLREVKRTDAQFFIKVNAILNIYYVTNFLGLPPERAQVMTQMFQFLKTLRLQNADVRLALRFCLPDDCFEEPTEAMLEFARRAMCNPFLLGEVSDRDASSVATPHNKDYSWQPFNVPSFDFP